jgi:periplasmic divalent cation tolerance protein
MLNGGFKVYRWIKIVSRKEKVVPVEHIFVYVTTSSVREAERIGERLVDEKLAACVNIFPMRSIYRWKGRIERAREAVLIVKTRKSLAERVKRRICELHSYELPCIVMFNIDGGLREFLRWISESTRKSD